jgi:TolA-binding protein
MGETMIEKLMTLLVGILLTLAGWSLSRTFQLSTIQAVHEEKVQKLEKHVEKLQTKMEDMMDKDEEIMDQHKKLFEALDNNQPTTGYNYN